MGGAPATTRILVLRIFHRQSHGGEAVCDAIILSLSMPLTPLWLTGSTYHPIGAGGWGVGVAGPGDR